MLDAASESRVATPSAGRLVIRIKLIPQEAPPARRRLSKSALLVLGVVAVVLGWIGMSTFRSDPPAVDSPKPAVAAPVTSSTEMAPVAPEVPEPSEAPTSPIHEVLPDVPQSALDTIRGTVRVSIRVTVDQQGQVVGATADDRGPSRYFERLALKASKQWTFTPSKSAEQRIMRVRFNFTRAGATAQANPAE